MRYLSTRGDPAPRRFCEILLEGLAPDGGLYLPERYPQVDAATLARWRGLRYPELAFEILSLYIDDIPAADLRALCERTYTRERFGTDAIVPLRPLEPGLWIEALSNGPTLAFKDMAMQLLGALFEYELARRGERLNILGATSGDTGSAGAGGVLLRRLVPGHPERRRASQLCRALGQLRQRLRPPPRPRRSPTASAIRAARGNSIMVPT